MLTAPHFQDLKKLQNVIYLINTRMGVPFQIATFVKFNYFKAHCFVLCVTIVALNILELFILIDCWQMVLFFSELFLK